MPGRPKTKRWSGGVVEGRGLLYVKRREDAGRLVEEGRGDDSEHQRIVKGELEAGGFRYLRHG